VIHPVAEGKSNKFIAIELGISMRTVEAHRARIFYKMGVRNAVQLAREVCKNPEP
jgi:DNA-binding NarL/FixJ family response regulator